MRPTEVAQESGADEARVPDWRAAAPTLVAVFILTRVLVVLVAAVLEFTVPLAYEPYTWSDEPILASLTGSDAVYYLGIADEGYHLEPVKEDHRDWVFFPVYPIAVRLASMLTLGDVALASVLVANAAFLGAMFALYRLGVGYLGHASALRSVVYLAIAPGAVSFVMAYSEGLFLLFAIVACLAAEQRRWALMAMLYALASATRLQGVLLGVPLLLLMMRAGGAQRPVALVGLLAGPLALGAFLLGLAAFTGDPLAYFHAQEAWTIPPLVDGSPDATPAPFNPLPFVLIATLLFHVFLLVYVRVDRLPPAYVAMAVLAIVVVLLGGRLQSVARYLVTAWPFAWLLAGRRAAWFAAAWPVASTGLFVFHAFAHFTQVLAP
jgi:hypothetical protein